MSKQKKKRNKAYRGIDAAVSKPTVTRLSATSRSRSGQWWFERKRFLKPILVAGLVVIVIIWLISVLVGFLVGS
jgi:hypothetical protein